jgi:hypothetical protein
MYDRFGSVRPIPHTRRRMAGICAFRPRPEPTCLRRSRGRREWTLTGHRNRDRGRSASDFKCAGPRADDTYEPYERCGVDRAEDRPGSARVIRGRRWPSIPLPKSDGAFVHASAAECGDRISFWRRRRLCRIMRVWERPMSSQSISHKTPGSLAAIDGAFPRT